MFTEQDLIQFKQRGISSRSIENQIANFKNGFPFLPLERAATVHDGIKSVDEAERKKWVNYFENNRGSLSILKFVPASGAATRMFKSLYSFLSDLKKGKDPATLLEDKSFQSLFNFFDRLSQFAFYDDLKNAYQQAKGENIEQALAAKKYADILEVLLGNPGLTYGELPKGLLKFHRDDSEARTPAEEHLVEAAEYGQQSGKQAKLHFTVSPEHRKRFDELINRSKDKYEQKYGINYQVTFSEQKPSTDTLAVDMANEPFREDGSILFRPAGHGALIYNLNEVNADLIFIKNIDNVVPDHMKGITVEYKKILAGILLNYKDRIFQFIEALVQGNADPDEIAAFVEHELCVESGARGNEAHTKAYLLEKLNRPIRVCGMVRNEGEPGGGPFWAKNPDGTFSLQVVESAQVDMNDPAQKEIFKKATHFNPVDLICYVKNYKGEKFDLLNFTDPETGFISQKSKDGRDLKAQELPGLWNGSMSNWNTVFVEVPIETFNPVKTVNDLLREEHKG